MATTSGLTIELNNFGSFKKQLDSLDKIIKSLDVTIDNTVSSLNKFDSALSKAAQAKGIKALANSLTNINTAVASFSATGASQNLANNILSFVRALNVGLDELKKVDAKALGPATRSLNSIRQFVKLFKDIDDEFLSLQKSFGGGFKGVLATFVRGDKITDPIKGIKSFTKIIAEALTAFDVIRQPEKIRAASQALDGLGPFIKTLNELGVRANGIDFVFGTRLSKSLLGVRKFTTILSDALSAFEKIRRPQNVEVAGQAIVSFVRIIKLLSDIPITGKDTILGDRLSKYLLGIRKFTSILADALSAFDRLKSPGNTLIAFQAIQSLSGLIKSLTEIQSGGNLNAVSKLFDRNSPLLTMLHGIRPFAKILTEALSSFEKIGDPTKVASVGFAIQSISKALPALFTISSNKKFSTEIKKNIAPAIIDLTNALSKAAGKAKDIQKIDSLAVAFERLSRSFSRFAITGGGIGSGKQIAQGISDIIDSVEQGFTSGDLEKTLLSSGEQGGKQFLAGLKKSLGIASPSKAMYEVAQQSGQGFMNGLKSFDFLGIGKGIAKTFIGGFAEAVDFLFNDVIRKVGEKVTQLGQTIQNIGRNITQTGKSALQTGISNLTAGGLFGFLQSGNVQLAASFDQVLNQIRVFGDLSETGLRRVSDAVLQFSADTIFDPTQSVNAFLALQKAGLSTADSLKELPKIGELAAAGELTLERATRIALGTMKTFGFTLEDQARINDAYVRAANNSVASVEELAQGMENISPIASNFGLSLEQTVAILALFNERGIVGAEAGTQLKSVLVNLTRPTKEVQDVFAELGVSLQDDAGNIKDFNTILNELNKSLNETKTVTYQATNISAGQRQELDLAQKALAAATRQIYLYQEGLSTGALGKNAQAQLERYQQVQSNAQSAIAEILGSQSQAEEITRDISRTQFENFQTISKLAGTFGQAGLTILLSEGEDAVNGFVDEMNKLPSAATIAAELMDTFAGTIESLKGSIQTLTLRAFIPLLKILNPVGKQAIKVVNAIAQLPEPILAAAAGLTLLIAAFTSLFGIGQIIVGLMLINVGPAITVVGTAFTILGSLLSVTFIPTLLAVGAAFTVLSAVMLAIGGAAALGIGVLAKVIHDVKNNVDGAGKAFNSMNKELKGLAGDIGGVVNSFLDFVGVLFRSNDETETIKDKMLRLSDAATTVESPIARVFNRIAELTKGIREFIGEVDAFFDFYNAINSPQETKDPALTEQEKIIQRIQDRIEEIKKTGTDAFKEAGKYTVKAGDTLYGIANQYGIDVEELARINNLSVDALNKREQFIRTGQDLVIPGQGLIASDEELDNLNKELIVMRERNNLDRDLMDRSTNSQTQEQRRLTNLQKTLKRFSQTSIFKRLFGSDESSALKAIAYVGIIQQRFDTIKDSVNEISRGFGLIFSGKYSQSLDQIQKGLGRIVLQILKFGEDIFGFDLSKRFEKQLSTGDFAGIVGDFIKRIFSAIGNAIADNIGNIAEFIIVSPINLGLKILEFLGIGDTSEIQSAISVFGSIVGNEIQKVVDGLTGSGDYAEGFKEVSDSVGEFVDSLARFATDITASDEAKKIIDAIVELTESNLPEITTQFDKLLISVQSFASNPSVQTLGKKLGEFILEIGKLVGFTSISGLLLSISIGLNLIESALGFIAGAFTQAEGFIEFLDGLAHGDGDKIKDGQDKIAQGTVAMAIAILGFPVGIAKDVLELMNDFGLVKNDGLKPFTDALALLPIIIEGILLNTDIKLRELGITIAKGLNDVIEKFNDVGEEIGVTIGEINVDNLEQDLEDAKARLDEFSVGLDTLGQRVGSGELSIDNLKVSFDQSSSDLQQQIIDELSNALNNATDTSEKIRINSALFEIDPELGAGTVEGTFGSGLIDAVNASLDINAATATPEQQQVLTSALSSFISDAAAKGFSDEDIAKIASAFDLNTVLVDALLNQPTDEDGATFSQIGVAVVDGTVSGITDSMDTATQAATDFGTGLIETLQSVLEISSPSQVTYRMGQNIVTGLTNGMITTIPLINGPLSLIRYLIDSIGISVLKTTQLISGGFFSAATSVETAAARMIIALTSINATLAITAGNASSAAIAIGTINSSVPSAAPASSSAIPGRADGGPIVPNQLYKINEPKNGVPNPEVFSSNGRDYMISPTGGYMRPTDYMGSSGMGGVSIQQSIQINIEGSSNGVDYAKIEEAARRGTEAANKSASSFVERARIRGTF